MKFKIRAICALTVGLTAGSPSLAQDASAEPPMLSVDVPLQVSDLAHGAYGIQISCDAMSGDGDFVATGNTYLIDNSVYEANKMAFYELMADDIAIVQSVDISNLDDYGTVNVEVIQNLGYQIDSWVTGRCDLFINHGAITNEVVLSSTPRECDLPIGFDDTVATCSWPGSELVSVVTFERPGFNEDGTLATLPGIDE